MSIHRCYKRYRGGAMQGAWSGCFQGDRGKAMQDCGYELRRIHIPRTPVNKGRKKGRGLDPQPFFSARCGTISPVLYLSRLPTYEPFDMAKPAVRIEAMCLLSQLALRATRCGGLWHRRCRRAGPGPGGTQDEGQEQHFEHDAEAVEAYPGPADHVERRGGDVE